MSDASASTPPPQSPVSPVSEPAPFPQTVTVRLVGRPFSRWFCISGWLGLTVCVVLLVGQRIALKDYFDTSQGIHERYYAGDRNGSDKVAIITVKGAILSSRGFVKKQIDRVRKDDHVKAIVVRVDSPGGTITASDYIYHHLEKLRKEKNVPLVVSMGGIAASGGYYVSMAVGTQENSIFAEPATTTGSIGVIVPHYDLTGLLKEYDIQDDSIVSHPRKQMLSMTRPITEENRKILQRYVDDAFGRFKEIVRKGRPAFERDPAALDQLATGEIFTATQAKQHGLVDEIGFIEDAVERAMELAGLSKDRTRVVEFERPPSLLEIPWLASSHESDSALSMLLELNTPQAYYLATTLPPLLSHRRAE